VPERARRIDISMIERKSFLQRDATLGTVSLDLKADRTWIIPELRGGNLALTLELLPPAALRCLTVPGRAKNYIAAMWLDIDMQHLREVSRVRYDRGSNFEQRFEDSRDLSAALDGFDSYTSMVSILVSQPIGAHVEFRTGSKIDLATSCTTGQSATGAPNESSHRAMAYAGARNFNAALREVDRDLTVNKTRALAHAVKADVLSNLQRYPEALEEYRQAIALAPDAPSLLNAYAWMIAEQLPSPSRSQLRDARDMAERALRAGPLPSFQNTLGWVEFKLGEYDQAVDDLRRAEALCVVTCRTSTDWQVIQFYLGQGYLAVKKKSDARRAFEAVLQYDKLNPDLSNTKYVEGAMAALK
jgi:tetratricopeptide (TPR) repeat protein